MQPSMVVFTLDICIQFMPLNPICYFFLSATNVMALKADQVPVRELAT